MRYWYAEPLLYPCFIYAHSAFDLFGKLRRLLAYPGRAAAILPGKTVDC
jgi:hypothetical protein